MTWKSCPVHTIGKILSTEEGGSNEQYLPSTQRETIQSLQPVSKLNKDTGFMMVKQILCKTRVYITLLSGDRVGAPASHRGLVLDLETAAGGSDISLGLELDQECFARRLGLNILPGLSGILVVERFRKSRCGFSLQSRI
jgi:hypothetical protein